MNGISRIDPHEPEDAGLDPELLQLFDATGAQSASPHEAAFVAALISKLERARRAQLIRRLIRTIIIMAAAALIAPYVAQLTLTAMDWLTEHLPQTGVALASPVGCIGAAFIAWRIARRQYS